MSPEQLPARLRLLGLRGVSRIVTHTNRIVMVSLGARRVLRIHQGYAYAPDRVLRAIVRFLDPALPRAVRRLAERFRPSPTFMPHDPWAQRAAGDRADLHSHIATVRPAPEYV